MMLYLVALLLVHTVLAVQGHNLLHKNLPANDINALCEDKSVLLLTISELQDLKSLVGTSRCSDNVKVAIPNLLTLINDTKHDLCAPESIDKLREFYSKYLDTSSEENKNREQLPKSLRKFALAYGMQMSSNCKRRMVHVLTNQGRDILYTEAHDAIRNLVSDKSPVADMLEGLAGPDEILLPGDLAPFIRAKQAEGANQEDNILYVQSVAGPYIREMQINCNKVFAPIYKPLIRPIVRLANMGFNYKDEPLRCDMGCSKSSKQLAQWSRLVFLCESLGNIHMVDVADQLGNSVDAETKAVRILTKEEADATGDNKDVSELEVPEHRYAAQSLPSSLIYNRKDRKLKKAIEAFSTSKSEEEKAAKRIMGKSVSMFKSQLKQHKIGFLFSKGYKAMLHRIGAGEKLKPSVEIVKVLDSAIGHEGDFADSGTNSKLENAKAIAKATVDVVGVTVLGILYIAVSILVGALCLLDGLLFGGHITKAIMPYIDEY